MADLKKVKGKNVEEVKVTVDASVLPEITGETENLVDDILDVEATADEQEVTTEVEKESKEDNFVVKVDTSIVPDIAKIPEHKDKSVRVRMRSDHKCNIGGVMYDLYAGQTYHVPDSVKRRLNKAGVLSPL